MRIKEILDRIIISRCGYHHEVSIPVSQRAIESSSQVKTLLSKVTLDIFVLDR